MNDDLSTLSDDEITELNQVLGREVDEIRDRRRALQNELRARHAKRQSLLDQLAALDGSAVQ